MLNAQICVDLLQCRVIAQPCCGVTHALLHVYQATLQKPNYDDSIIFHAICLSLERQ